MRRERTEWKFLCSAGKAVEIENRLRGILSFDKNYPEDGTYNIHSLYFDDYRDRCWKDNEGGYPKRFKYRVRYYGDAPTLLRLERKDRVYDRGGKESCTLNNDEFTSLHDGQTDALFWNTENAFLRSFCLRVQTESYQPKVIIDYRRTAFSLPVPDIRVTLDRAVTVSPDCGAFLSPGEYITLPLLPEKTCILEVKFDSILPGYLRKLLDDGSLRRVSFSKYTRGRQAVRAAFQ